MRGGFFYDSFPLSFPSPRSDFLDTHIYLTRGWKDNQAFAIMLREGDDRDAITGLQAKTHFGRPDWPNIFDGISLSHPKYVQVDVPSTRDTNIECTVNSGELRIPYSVPVCVREIYGW